MWKMSGTKWESVSHGWWGDAARHIITLIQPLWACGNLSHAQRISRTQKTVRALFLEMTISTMAQHSNEILENMTKTRGYYVPMVACWNEIEFFCLLQHTFVLCESLTPSSPLGKIQIQMCEMYYFFSWWCRLVSHYLSRILLGLSVDRRRTCFYQKASF